MNNKQKYIGVVNFIKMVIKNMKL